MPSDREIRKRPAGCAGSQSVALVGLEAGPPKRKSGRRRDGYDRSKEYESARVKRKAAKLGRAQHEVQLAAAQAQCEDSLW